MCIVACYAVPSPEEPTFRLGAAGSSGGPATRADRRGMGPVVGELAGLLLVVVPGAVLVAIEPVAIIPIGRMALVVRRRRRGDELRRPVVPTERPPERRQRARRRARRPPERARSLSKGLLWFSSWLPHLLALAAWTIWSSLACSSDLRGQRRALLRGEHRSDRRIEAHEPSPSVPCDVTGRRGRRRVGQASAPARSRCPGAPRPFTYHPSDAPLVPIAPERRPTLRAGLRRRLVRLSARPRRARRAAVPEPGAVPGRGELDLGG